MVTAEKKVWYTNVQQQPVTRKKCIVDWLKNSLKNDHYDHAKSLKFVFNFMLTVLPFQVMYGKWKQEKNVIPALTWEVNITKRVLYASTRN